VQTKRHAVRPEEPKFKLLNAWNTDNREVDRGEFEREGVASPSLPKGVSAGAAKFSSGFQAVMVFLQSSNLVSLDGLCWGLCHCKLYAIAYVAIMQSLNSVFLSMAAPVFAGYRRASGVATFKAGADLSSFAANECARRFMGQWGPPLGADFEQRGTAPWTPHGMEPPLLLVELDSR